jgi:hypothetical protein
MADQAFIEKVRELKAAGKSKDEVLAELGQLSAREKISVGMAFVNRRKGASAAKAKVPKKVKAGAAKASPVSHDEKDLIIEELRAENEYLKKLLAIRQRREVPAR